MTQEGTTPEPWRDHRHDAAPPPRRRRVSRVFLALLALVVASAISFGIGVGIVGRLFPIDVVTRGVDEYPDLVDVWSYGNGDTKVVRIPVRGPILRSQDDGLFGSGQDPVESVLRQIRSATKDPEVKAIILEIDSPGGGITASDVIYNELLAFKASASDRRIVALFEDIAASGGYYIAMAADRIVAHPTTITGSIGVLISTLNVKGLAERIGIEAVTIKSGENKDILNPFEDLTEEQRAILQNMIDEMHARFVDVVAEGRGLERSAVEAVADGRIFTVNEAKQSGLVDEVGYWEAVVRAAASELEVEEIKVFRYERVFSFSSWLFGSQNLNVSARSLLMSRPRLMYMWSP